MKRNIIIHNMKRRTPTTLEYALLGLVHGSPRSGYDLCKVFESTPMAHYSSSPGAIYPALKRLEQAGLLAGTVERADSMRPRKRYSITSEGTATLKSWVSAQVQREDLVWRSGELMLRFSFMGQLVSVDAVRRFLAQLLEAIDEYVEELQTHYHQLSGIELPEHVSPTGRLALKQGIGSFRELRRWARESLEELNPS